MKLINLMNLPNQKNLRKHKKEEKVLTKIIIKIIKGQKFFNDLKTKHFQ